MQLYQLLGRKLENMTAILKKRDESSYAIINQSSPPKTINVQFFGLN